MIDDADPIPTEANSDFGASTFDHDPHATRLPGPSETDVDADIDPHATRFDEAGSGPGGGAWSEGGRGAGGNRFRIIRPHARGAIGEVFLAHDGELRREVALKEIQDRHADDPRSRARFLLEAEVTGSLEHPGIIPVYGLGHHADGRPYYAMRFIRGDSLKESVDRHQRPGGPRQDPISRSLELRKHLRKFVDICNAMAYAHSQGVLHRDLKPGNVMLGPYGEALVVDWGLAKSLARPDPATLLGDSPPTISGGDSCETIAGSVIGTPAFMSPEQAAGELDRLGPASDIYSLGATLYYVLTGKTPFDGLEVLEILARAQEGKFPEPRKVRRDVPRPLQAIALKAMAHRPEDRYATARGLAEDVERWLSAASVSAYPDGILVRSWRWARDHPALMTAAVACLFLDVSCVVIALLLYVQEILHAESMPRLNLAAGVLALSPFAAQAGALAGTAAGAILGLAWRRGWSGLRRGAGVGLGTGVVAAFLAWLAAGAFGLVRPPDWMTGAPSPSAVTPLASWPRLPGASSGMPRWIDAGLPPGVVQYFEEPPPSENAAPLYLDALFEFNDQMAPCFPPDEAAWRVALVRPREQEFVRLRAAWQADPASVDRRALDALLEGYEVGFAKLGQAQRLPRCAFRPALGAMSPLPHAQATRAVARVAALRALRALERGEVDRAIDDLGLVLRLAWDLRPRGSLIVQLVCGSLEQSAESEVLPAILAAPGLRLDQLDRVLAILRDHDARGVDPIVEGYRSEYVMIGQTLHLLVDRLVREESLGGSRARNALRSVLPMTSMIDLPDFDSRSRAEWLAKEAAVDAQLAKTPPGEFVERSMRAYDAFYKAAVGLASRPTSERVEAIDRLREEALAGQPLLLYLCPPGGPGFFKAVGRAEATRGASKCLVALRRQQLANQGEGTPDLESAVKAAGMDRVPTDPFRADGGPLRLGTADGSPVVYSVGIDGRDDGGRVDAEFGSLPEGDYLYPIGSTARRR